MKVLVITTMYPQPGAPHAGSFIKSQVESIVKEGVEVELINVNQHRGFTKYVRAWFKLFLKSFDPAFDLIHAHYGFCGMIGFLQWKLPVLVSFCGGDVLGNPNAEGKLRMEYLLLLPFSWCLSMLVPAVIVKSKEMKSKLPAKKNMYVIPNGVDFDLFKPMDKRDAREKLGLPLKKKLVLFPANPDWPRKAYPIASEAVELLKLKGMDVELVVAHSMTQDIIPVYMNACDAMLLTSYWEGSPNVVKESMACNLPIVAADVGDVQEIINGCSLCYVTERQPRHIAEKVEIILNTEGRTNGRSLIAHLQIQTVAKQVVTIYKNLIRQ